MNVAPILRLHGGFVAVLSHALGFDGQAQPVGFLVLIGAGHERQRPPLRRVFQIRKHDRIDTVPRFPAGVTRPLEVRAHH